MTIDHSYCDAVVGEPLRGVRVARPAATSGTRPGSCCGSGCRSREALSCTQKSPRADLAVADLPGCGPRLCMPNAQRQVVGAERRRAGALPPPRAGHQAAVPDPAVGRPHPLLPAVRGVRAHRITRARWPLVRLTVTTWRVPARSLTVDPVETDRTRAASPRPGAAVVVAGTSVSGKVNAGASSERLIGSGPPASGRSGRPGTRAAATGRTRRPWVSMSTTSTGSSQCVPRASTARHLVGERAAVAGRGRRPARPARGSASARSRCPPGHGRAARRRSAPPRAGPRAGRTCPPAGASRPRRTRAGAGAANFSQCGLRSPKRYVEVRRLLTMPSRPCWRVASKSIAPSSYGGGGPASDAVDAEPGQQARVGSPAARRRGRGRRGGAGRRPCRSRARPSASRAAVVALRTCIRSWRVRKSGRPRSLSAMISPSTSRSRSPSGLVDELGPGDR